MLEENNDQPKLAPVGEGQGLNLKLKGQDGPQLEGQKRCPHCERMIPESDRVCMQCGFDLKSGKTQQERERKSGGPVKIVAAIAVLAGLAYAGYKYQEQIKNLIEGKTGTEISDDSGDNTINDTVEGSGEEKATLSFDLDGADPEELREELKMQVEDLKDEYKGISEELAEMKKEVKADIAEMNKAKANISKFTTLTAKYKAAKNRTKYDQAKDRLLEAKENYKEYSAEVKVGKKEYEEINTTAKKLKKQISDASKKIKQLDAYISQQ